MRYYRKVIQIRAEDSPNVKLGLLQERMGETPSNEIIVPGVLPFDMYKKRRATWDQVRQCIGLDARWWAGADLLLYPPEWLNRANQYAVHLTSHFGGKHQEWSQRRVKSVGVDTGQGTANTSFTAVDSYGLKELVSYKTPDTAVTVDISLMFMARHQIKGEQMWFDGGGGGKEIADQLRRKGHKVNTVFFGESTNPRPRRKRQSIKEKVEVLEDRHVYKNRRAEMYHLLRLLLDPSRPLGNEAFAIPEEYTNLRNELAPIPLLYDQEGKIYMLPKHKKDANSDEQCLADLIGHSPDEADSLVLAVYGMTQKPKRKLGAG